VVQGRSTRSCPTGIDRVFAFAEVPAALRRFETREALGKVVITHSWPVDQLSGGSASSPGEHATLVPEPRYGTRALTTGTSHAAYPRGSRMFRIIWSK
jgi:hypothetical protein